MLKFPRHFAGVDGVACIVQVPEAASYYSLEASSVSWKFPEPGFLEGVKTKDKAILKMTQTNFKYPGAEKYILKDVNVQVL
jgi:elongation factor 3